MIYEHFKQIEFNDEGKVIQQLQGQYRIKEEMRKFPRNMKPKLFIYDEEGYSQLPSTQRNHPIHMLTNSNSQTEQNSCWKFIIFILFVILMVFLFFLFTAPNSVAEKSENEILKNTDEIFKKLWQSDKPLPLIDFYVENKKLYGDEVWLFFMKKLISEDNCLINEKNDEISCKKIKDDGL